MIAGSDSGAPSRSTLEGPANGRGNGKNTRVRLTCCITEGRGAAMISKRGYNPCTPIEARQSSFSAALLVLLNGQTKEITTRTSNTSTKGGWLSCTRELRLISLQVCNDCRQQLAFHVRVDRKTPRSLLENRPLLQPQGASRLHDDDGGKTSRVLGVRATSVEWDRSIEELAQNEMFLEAVTTLMFGFHFNDRLALTTPLVWPRHLKRLNLGYRFDQDMSSVPWPCELEELTFGTHFNHPVDRVQWPSKLKKLTFGSFFNKPVGSVVWPESLQRLEFGRNFDQPVDAVRWPSVLKAIVFGSEFSHTVQGMVWPRGGLKLLTFAEGFSGQPLDSVAWPDTIEELNLECVSIHPRGQVRWPRALKRLKLDLGLQRIQEVTWPVTLEELEFGDRFNQRVDGVRWPMGLRRLTFGRSFDRPVDGAMWPIALLELRFGCMFNQPLQRVSWPRRLQRLSFRDHFDQPACGVRWPRGLEELSFGGWAFKQQLGRDVAWPVALRKLTLGRSFLDEHPPASVALPASLVELEVGQGCKRCLKGVKWPRGLRILTADRAAVGEDELQLGLPAGCRIRRR